MIASLPCFVVAMLFVDPTLGKQNSCQDIAFWKSSNNENCLDYAVNSYCTSNGGFGVGWNSSTWGSHTDYADPVTGISATDACCACGGGVPIQLFTCSDVPEWRSTNSLTCQDFEDMYLCSDHCVPSTGWLPEWGSILEYADAKI